MKGSDFNNLPGSEYAIVAAVIACIAIVISLWELAKFLVPHIHIYWR